MDDTSRLLSYDYNSNLFSLYKSDTKMFSLFRCSSCDLLKQETLHVNDVIDYSQSWLVDIGRKRKNKTPFHVAFGVITLNSPNELILFHPETNKRDVFASEDAFLCICASTANSAFYIGCDNGNIVRYNIIKKKPKHYKKFCKSSIVSIKVTQDRLIILQRGSTELGIYNDNKDLDNLMRLKLENLDSSLASTILAVADSALILGREDGSNQIYDYSQDEPCLGVVNDHSNICDIANFKNTYYLMAFCRKSNRINFYLFTDKKSSAQNYWINLSKKVKVCGLKFMTTNVSLKILVLTFSKGIYELKQMKLSQLKPGPNSFHVSPLNDVEEPVTTSVQQITPVDLSFPNDLGNSNTILQTLHQVIHTRDDTLFNSIIFKTNDKTINETVKILDAPSVVKVLSTLVDKLYENPTLAPQTIPWLRAVFLYHHTFLSTVTFDHGKDPIKKLHNFCEKRVTLGQQLQRIKGTFAIIDENLKEVNEEIQLEIEEQHTELGNSLELELMEQCSDQELNESDVS